MIKKNVLVLLLALSASVSVFSAETDVVLPEIDVVVTEVQETPATSTDTVEPKASISDKMAAYLPTIDGGTKRTLQRSALLFASHNLLSKTYASPNKIWKQGFGFNTRPIVPAYQHKFNEYLRFSADFLNIIAKYFIDTRFEKTNNSTPAEIVEWIAGELVLVQEYDQDKDDAYMINIKQRTAKAKLGQLFLKAASRKQLWLADELETTQILKNSMVRWVLTASEKGEFNINGCKFATIGMISEKVADDLLVILAATNKLPKCIVNFMETDHGYNLVRDLLAKAIEKVGMNAVKNLDCTTQLEYEPEAPTGAAQGAAAPKPALAVLAKI